MVENVSVETNEPQDYNIYLGDSEGFLHVVNGYIDFAQYSIGQRAVPDLRDGLKPVQRRILLQAESDGKLRKGLLTKSLDLVGQTSHRHPHGDSAIYDAMVRMTETNGSFNIPLLVGEGNLSKFYMKEGPAASRYTKVGLQKNYIDFFSEMDGITLVRDEAEEDFEPSALPVRYPYILCVQQQGLAVSVNTNTPSFNFWDVLTLTESYIKKSLIGDTLDEHDVIYPDFTSGGHYIVDNREVFKVMKTGIGALKVRADVEIVGKEIHVNEVPVGTTVTGILSKISAFTEEGRYLNGVKSAYDSVNIKDNVKIKIECKSLKVVEDTLIELYGLNILQSSMSTRITALNGQRVVIGGVFRLIEEWVEWRKTVVVKDAEAKLESLKDEIRRLRLFVQLVADANAKEKYLELASKVGKAEASKYLLEDFAPNEGYIQDDAEWVSERKVSAFLNGGTYRGRYESLNDSIEEYENRLNDVEAFLLRDIESLRAEHAGLHKRKTELTKKDYRFTRASEGEDEGDVTDTSPAWFTMYRNGFLKKTRDLVQVAESDILCQIAAPANSTLIGFTSYGQVIRIYGEQVPFMRDTSGAGLYVPKYLGLDLEQAAEQGFNDFNILYMDLLDGKDRMLLFKDGKASFLTTSKWYGVGARHKIVSSGVNANVLDQLVDVIHEDNFPENIVVVDNGLGREFRYGITKFNTIRRPKGTVGQAQVFKGGTGKFPMNIVQWAGLTNEEASNWVNDDFPHIYQDKISKGMTGDPETDMNFDLGKFVEPSFSSVS